MKNKKSANSRREFITNTGTVAGLSAFASLFASGAHAQNVEINAMGPTAEQAQAFAQLPDQPVVMVNLLKFSDEGSYDQYEIDVVDPLAQVGAEIIFSGECQATLIGGTEWDRVILVRYPNSRALLQMSQSPEYQAISVSRRNGLEGQMNLAVFEN
ncbi:MAG TPA: DUF1330 domain-containing protein [Dehalococcoidia bacterium]|nr:DUF1330 domain-containing protein [Dehalococcoidia bacterium]